MTSVRPVLCCAALAALLAGCAGDRREPPSMRPAATATRATPPPNAAALRRMRGTYTHGADGGVFVECGSGTRLAVAPEGAGTALQLAYTTAQTGPGVPALATLDARVAMRAAGAEGSTLVPVLLVERVVALTGGRGC